MNRIFDGFQVVKLLMGIEEKAIRHDFHEIGMPGIVKSVMSCQVVYPGRMIGQCVCVSLVCQEMMPETYRYAVHRFTVKSCLHEFSLSLCHGKASLEILKYKDMA